MRYCQRCCYPENAQPSIIFDDQGVCSGCRVVESRPSIDWAERERWLVELLQEYKAKAKTARNPYDCIIPVSGGKDSAYQVIRLLPTDGDDCQYRIKSSTEAFERVAKESQLALS